jgi:16S rRNA (cytidine1402-2'-O)-methyltransferase
VGRDLVTAGTLHIVATPLGNLGDLAPRAAQVLKEADIVAAEDTRRTRPLLSHIGAHPRQLLSLHAHTPPSRIARIVEALEEGRHVALVTDAGTPTISDPGAQMVRAARAAGVPVVSVPGPSAVTAALSISGFPADRYQFLGFAPRKGTERRRWLTQVAASPWTVVCFEAPTRLVALLEHLSEACGSEREAAVARELTKVHEELKSGTLAELAVYYTEHAPRGEVTVVIAGGDPVEHKVEPQDAEEMARALLARGMSRRDAATELASTLGLPRREAYRMVMAL